MKIKKILIIAAISIVIGLITFFNFYPIPTLFEFSPHVSIKSEINGYMDANIQQKIIKRLKIVITSSFQLMTFTLYLVMNLKF